MQLPYIVKQMEGASFSLVPILVGSLTKKSEDLYGSILVKYFEDPENFFVISSDFCHWGNRFDYFHYEEEVGPIWKSIELLDRRGMDAIETQNPDNFSDYLKKYSNTICGRHPIGVLLQMIKHSKQKLDVRFVHYAQSNKCMEESDHSVSYAVAVVART